MHLSNHFNYLNTANKNVQWVVGYFTEENKYSIIPYCRIITCGNLHISKWPKSGNINILIQTSFEPEIDWPTYPVKIVSEYFNSYDEAAFKERQIFISVSSSESKEHVVQNKNKRNKHVPQVHEDSSDTCCSASQTPIKIFKTSSSSKISSKQGKIDLNTLYEEELTTNHLKSNTISSAMNLMYNMTEDDLNAALVTPSAYVLPVRSTPTETHIHSMSSTITNNKEPSTSTHTKSDFSKNQKDIYQSVHENIIMTLGFVKRIEGKLDRIEAQLQSGVTVNTTVNNNILSQLIMKTVLDVENMETKFSTDPNFKSQMRNVIFRNGGTNSKNFIKRTLQRLFTNELSIKYTWTGFRQHNHLHGLQIVEIIKEIAVNTFSSIESDFEAHVKDCSDMDLNALAVKKNEIFPS